MDAQFGVSHGSGANIVELLGANIGEAIPLSNPDTKLNHSHVNHWYSNS